MIIKSNDPIETRDLIVTWLNSLAIHFDSQSRIAKHKTVQRSFTLRADTIRAAAKFIKEIVIEP